MTKPWSLSRSAEKRAPHSSARSRRKSLALAGSSCPVANMRHAAALNSCCVRNTSSSEATSSSAVRPPAVSRARVKPPTTSSSARSSARPTSSSSIFGAAQPSASTTATYVPRERSSARSRASCRAHPPALTSSTRRSRSAIDSSWRVTWPEPTASTTTSWMFESVWFCTLSTARLTERSAPMTTMSTETAGDVGV